ncbi:MAG: hypothetical protein ACTSPY_17870, partial [Candidatus Helarchaeota archaeon]
MIVNITDSSPISNHPIDITTSANGIETIPWILVDDFGGGQYRVWANDTSNNYYVWVDWTSWTNDTVLNVIINRSAPGIYNYTIEFYDDHSNFGLPDTVIVNITDSLPISNHPIDITTSTSGSETIPWVLTDDFGGGQYRVWANDTSNDYYVWVDWTPWTNNTVLNVIINRSAPGIYNYTIEFYDDHSNFGIPDTVIITVQDNLPISNHPIDITTSVSGTENITWTLTDDFGPGQYRVWVNDTNNNYYVWVDWTPWTNNTVLNVIINRSAPGIYNYTIEFYDDHSNFGIPDTVIITVQDNLPISNYPIDITTSASGTENITWTLTDDFGPGQYRVWVNDTLNNYYIWIDWTPWTNNTAFSVPINRSKPGIYNYTIEYTDDHSNLGLPDMVIVNITDSVPISDHPIDITTSASGTENITWTLTDDFGGGQYRIWVNDTLNNYYVWITWTSWTNNTAFSVPINRSAPGIYNYTIEFYDDHSNFGLPDMVIVNITNNPPSSNNPVDIITSASGSETIPWVLMDDFGGAQYRVWANNSAGSYYIWIDWTPWTNNTILNVPINRSRPGIYNYTIEYRDKYTNDYGIPDMVIVNITDNIPSSNHPIDIITTANGTEIIPWVLTDDFGGGQYRVWANDSVGSYYILTDWAPWTNNTFLNVPINRTIPGIYNYTIEFTDNYNNFGLSDMVIITVIDTIPESNHPDNLTTTAYGTDVIEWRLWDDYGSGFYQVYINSIPMGWASWSNNTVISYPIDKSAPGLYNYTIIFNDSNNNWGTPDTVYI